MSGLSPAWIYTAADDVSATPSVDLSGNAVYFPDWSGLINKVDSNLGTLIWSHPMTDYGLQPGAISRTTPTLVGNMIILTASAPLANPVETGAYVIAIDPSTGNLIWSVNVGSGMTSLMTGSPMVFNNVIYVGVSSSEERLTNPTFRGFVIALSVSTGQTIWKTYMTPPGYTGAPIWSSTPAVDIARNQLYVTTGNNYLVPESVQQCEQHAGANTKAAKACQAPSNYEDSIVALNLSTGAINWGTKCSVTDAWIGACPNGPACPDPEGKDYDFGSGPNFMPASVTGASTDLVGAGQKSGVFWALNPDNGDVVWKQFVGPGGLLGGIEWGTAADNQRIYVAVANSGHQPYSLYPTGMPWNGGAWSALDIATGAILWQTPDLGMNPMHPMIPALALGPVTVANGVLYGASTSGEMYAMDASTGNVLWSYLAPGSVNAAPAIINGTVFWGTGYHHFPAKAPIGTASNRFYSFTLNP
nr:PQQ-binding-like beta-propeller repeat protein [Nevskia soli]